ARRALLLSRNGESSPNGARADPGAHPGWTRGRPLLRTGRRSQAADDQREGSGREKAIGERDTATRGSTQLKRVRPHVISMGTGLLPDVGGMRNGRRRTIQ